MNSRVLLCDKKKEEVTTAALIREDLCSQDKRTALLILWGKRKDVQLYASVEHLPTPFLVAVIDRTHCAGNCITEKRECALGCGAAGAQR